MRKLRLSHVVVQPVLVWDDGEELVSGPQVQPNQLTLSALEKFVVELPGEVARIEAELAPADDV